MVRNSQKYKVDPKRRDRALARSAASTLRLAALVALFGLSAGGTLAQTSDVDDSFPPPPKIISDQEKSQLESTNDVKKRTNLALEFMDARMLKAEQFHDSQELDAMFLELGAFHALIDHTLLFLDKKNKEGGKVLNNFKRFEMGLRKFTPRLEVIRRDLPLRYEFYPRALVRYIREARTKAIEPLFGDSVVPSSKP